MVLTLDEFIEYVKTSSRHSCLYHFTDSANFPLIREHGLLSKALQTGMGVSCPFPGGDEASHVSDMARGIYNDVSLSLTNNHPMAYVCREAKRHLDQYYLTIDPEVLRMPGVRFVDGMANARATTIYPIEEAINILDIEVIYRQPPWSEEVKARLKVARKYEILIPAGVPRRMILKKFKAQ